MPAKANTKCLLFSERNKSRIMGSISVKAGYWICRLYHLPGVPQAKPDRRTLQSLKANAKKGLRKSSNGANVDSNAHFENIFQLR